MNRFVIRSIVVWGGLLVLVVAVTVSGIALANFADLSTGAATAAGSNLVQSGSFETIAPWGFVVRGGATAALYQDSASKEDGTYSALVDVMQSDSAHPWNVELYQTGIAITSGEDLSLSFWAKGSTQRDFTVVLQHTNSPDAAYFDHSVHVTSDWQRFTFDYTPSVSDTNTLLGFNLAGAIGRVWLDNASISPITSSRTTQLSATITLAPTALATSTTAPAPSPNSTPASASGMKLVFDDEFNGASLDTTKWTAVTGHQWGGPADFTPQDVNEAFGNLDLMTEQRSSNGYAYTTGMVTTQGKFDFLYGRVDIRAKLPKGQGIWPALWMITTQLPTAYETDIMEMVGDAPQTVYMTTHDWATGNQYAQGKYTGADFSADFHVFSIVWEPGRITWYVDGVQRFQTTQYVSNMAMYIMLDIWVGESGSWPGAPDGTTAFPEHLDVDYVRVYQRQ